MNRSREGLEWNVRKWKSEIGKTVKGVGLSGINARRFWNGTERKKSHYM